MLNQTSWILKFRAGVTRLGDLRALQASPKIFQTPVSPGDFDRSGLQRHTTSIAQLRVCPFASCSVSLASMAEF